MKYLILISLLLSGCGRFSPSPTSSTSTPKHILLKHKASIYKELLKDHQDEYGFIGTEECDATLWSGLLGSAYPGEVDLLAAKGLDGTWYRRSGQDCGPEFGNSKSTISRDMMLGVLWHFWTNKQRFEAELLMKKLKSNSYVMPGEGPLSRMLITPTMLNTLANIIKALGGPNYDVELLFPPVITEGEDYTSHLSTWHILLRGEIFGDIPQRNFDILEKLAKREPHNPLYQAAYHKYLDGDQTKAIDLLLDESQWPATSLPTSENHCAYWVIQRDKGKDWLPCPDRKPNHQHDGAEWLVVYKLLIEEK